jgi:hypothetical protein
MRALLFVAEALLAEGGDFLRPGVARQPDPATRLARRLMVLSFALRSLAACLERQRDRADRRVVERCRLHVVSCGKQHCHWGIAGANGLAGRCLSLDMRR